MNLAICMNVPMICDFIFVYSNGNSKFDCLANVLLVCSTLKQPTIWQLGKNNFDSYGRLPLVYY
jgi:hypothetical protein